MRVLLLFILFVNISYALESTDRFETRILKAYPDNILVINRGLEDGIEVGDHGRLTNEDGFIARGICIERGMLSSHWKIYRVVRPELVSKDTTYILTAINQSEMPQNLREKYLGTKKKGKVSNWDESKLNRALELQQERIARSDLPQSNENDPLYLESQKSGGTKFIEKNFDGKKFSQDLSDYKVSLYASPFSMQSFNNQKNLVYGASIESLGEKYQLRFHWDERDRSFTDPMTQIQFQERMRDLGAEFKVKRLTNRFDLFFGYNFHSKQYSENYIPKSRHRLAPLGASFFLMRNEDKNEELSLSYAPLIEKRLDSINQIDVEESNVRHSVRLRYKDNLSDHISFDTYYLWQGATKDIANIDNIFEFKLSYKMAKYFYTDFIYTFTDDYYQALNTGLDSKNNIYTVNLRLDFEL